MTKLGTKTSIAEEMQQIRRLRIMGIPHEDIKKRLKLSDFQYNKRVNKINKIDKEYLVKEFHNELATDIMNTRARIESVIQMCDRIMTNDEADPFARLDAGRLTIHCSIGLVKLYNEGPRILANSNLSNVIISEQQKLEQSQYGNREYRPDYTRPIQYDPNTSSSSSSNINTSTTTTTTTATDDPEAKF